MANPESFGAVFGRRVTEERGRRGWSQSNLGTLVFRDREDPKGEGHKADVSKLERGEIPNPQARTVNAYARVLEIPMAEVNAMRAAARHPDTGMVERLRAENTDLAARLKLRESLVLTLAYTYAEGRAGDFDAAYRDLENALKVAAEQRDLSATPTNHPDFLDAVLTRVADLNAAGETAAAGAELDLLIERLDAEAEEQTARQVRARDTAVQQAVIEGDAMAAAGHLVARARLDRPESLFDAIRQIFVRYRTTGLEKGVNFDLEIAIALAGHAGTAARDADQRGTALNDLGVVQTDLGQREAGTERLEQAETAYRAALKEMTRERVPLDWARAQMNLGSALWTLGQREAGTERLEQAVTAYRAALEEWTRERAPLDWATVQMNLGNALRALGAREAGTERLEQAVTAYRAALKEMTRERVPLDWATVQMNLGSALATLGQREAGTERLEQAVTAYRAALEEWTRERVPLDWATVQMNLGAALRTLGEREAGTERLEQAVTAYRAALEERTRERVPLDWARTQMNLGNALATLGEREAGTERLEQAVTAYRAALEEWTRERVPLDWAMVQMNLGNALQTLGEREAGTERLEQAVTAYRAALEEWTRERVPLDWATVQFNIARVEIALFDKTGDTARLDAAEGYVRAALEVFEDAGATQYLKVADEQLATIDGRRE